MRWTIRIGTALALLWAVYAISPYFAAYRLVTAVQARDVEALKERVNFHAVRTSLAQQILAVYFSATGEGNVSEAAARQLASVAAEEADVRSARRSSRRRLAAVRGVGESAPDPG